MLQYAEAEARAILIVNLKIVHALVGAILVAGSLSGDEVDEVIFREISAQGVAVERANRDDWRRRQASAARFLVDQQGRA